MNDEVFAVWEFNKIHFEECKDDDIDATIFVICLFDGYPADGHPYGTNRTLHHIKISGFPEGLEG